MNISIYCTTFTTFVTATQWTRLAYNLINALTSPCTQYLICPIANTWMNNKDKCWLFRPWGPCFVSLRLGYPGEGQQAT
ncbi:uncharacterized protein BDW70DRAFT_8178 [Aspergillus foveolatus]|uniref:uncharacterized protein n=1 Tax=Aspergillus foveolatus TaxID=210207 RepID=UPI003CCD4F86